MLEYKKVVSGYIRRMSMLEISEFLVDGVKYEVTDLSPRFQFALHSDIKDTFLKEATLSFSNGEVIKTTSQTDILYNGKKLEPFTEYKVTLSVIDNHDDEATKTLSFKTGKLNSTFIGKWISDSQYQFTEKRVSPKVMAFRKEFIVTKKIKSCTICSTALGIYNLYLNGNKVGDTYFAPGFTSYHNNLQYQVYDVKDLIQDGTNNLLIYVAGGWAIGSFVFTRVNRYYHDRQALLLDMHIKYEDDSEEVISSNETFNVTMDTPYELADLYDGETYDANLENKGVFVHKASIEKLDFTPELLADYSSPVKVRDTLKPTYLKDIGNQSIYDFKQNFAGIINLKIKGAKGGERIVIHHAEVLNSDGTLNLSLLRTAKATLTYICKEGDQEYHPSFTYMGFRYISIEGIDKDKVIIEGLLLSSLDKSHSEFECDNELLNRLEKNIHYSALSNFMDIPTDCPQRDERMGWTGDISIFSDTACYQYSIDRFLRKWLKDVKKEQLKTGGLPNTVPIHGYGFPATMPKMAIDFWGDAVLTVPYSLYMNYGDKSILSTMYDSMKKYVKACKFWANIGIGKHRYIWHTPSMFHFGDWVSPDVDKMSAWQKRSKFTATASLYHTSSLLSHIASILGKDEDSKYFKKLSMKVADSYSSIFMDKDGRLKKEQFQTGYVLPIAFDMLDEIKKKGALKNLVELVKKNDYCIGTGFPGTPYILFALIDNGYSDVAYKMLLNTKAPSWLYGVKAGGTTIFEKFDGLNEDGTARKSTDGTDNMISFNHYASGSVGEFLYTRLAGLRIIEPGYKSFEIKPIFTDEIKYVKTKTHSVYGDISLSYHHDGKQGKIDFTVPVSTKCKLSLPNQEEQIFTSGSYSIEFTM